MRTWLIVALLVFGMAGCTEEEDETPAPGLEGGDTDGNETPEPTPPEPVTVQVKLSGAYPANIAYDPATITVPANSNVTIVFTNNDQNTLVNHDWVLEGVDGAATAVIGNGEKAEVTFLAPEPGTYSFYCSVPGHRGNGMEGTFTVSEPEAPL